MENLFRHRYRFNNGVDIFEVGEKYVFVIFWIGTLLAYNFSSKVGAFLSILVFFGISFFISIYDWIRNGKKGFTISSPVFLWGLYCSYFFVITIFWNVYYSDMTYTLRAVLEVVILGMLAVFTCVQLGKSYGLEETLVITRNVGLGLAAFGLVEIISSKNVFNLLIFKDMLKDNMSVNNVLLYMYQERVKGIFSNPIIYASFLTLLLLVLLYKPINNRILQILSVSMVGINILFTFSRTSWIAVLVVLTIFILERYKKSIIAVKMIGGITGIGILLFVIANMFTFQGKMGQLLLRLNVAYVVQSEPFVARIGNVKNVLLDWWQECTIVEKIIGKGWNQAVQVVYENPVAGFSMAVDNQWVTILYDAGMIGMFMLIVFFIVCFRIVRRNDTENAKIARGILIAQIIGGFFYESFAYFNTMFILGILFIIIDSEQDALKMKG